MMLLLQHPFTAIVVGPTGCGKTQFVFRLMENATWMIQPAPEQIWYCYGEFQPTFERYAASGVRFHEGLPDFSQFDGRRHVLLVIDDLMAETDATIANLFTKGSHHRNISVLYLTQNLFHRNKHMHTISLNVHYMVLFKNPRDAGQFAVLARQMYLGSGASKFAEKAYADTTERPFSYLLLDLKPQQDDDYGHLSGGESLRLRKEEDDVDVIKVDASVAFAHYDDDDDDDEDDDD